DGQIDQAVRDAIVLVLQEALNHTALFAVDMFGADEATRRVARPPRKNIEKKAMELLRNRHAPSELRKPGRVEEWTALELRNAVLNAMKRIENVKNRTKGRVAAIFYGENYEQLTTDGRRGLTRALNDLIKGKVDYEELEKVDDLRRHEGV